MSDRGSRNGVFPQRAEVARVLTIVVRSINDGYTDAARTAADGLADMIRERQWTMHAKLVGDDAWLHALPEALQDVRDEMRSGKPIGVEALTRLRALEAEARA